MPAVNDFYEDDEPVEDVLAAFEAGEKQLTEPPSRGRTLFVDVARNAQVETGNTSSGELVQH
ncbi:hypothetical protein [Actinomycetospora sp. NBRC 106378]|uniref:hypothetical protein n=1 Tax=Actinomycetospora sp. NBRC 106378 TaxID=3032208 RepID=UPI0024A34A8A|nr:hypothetical protein [Actinomycetospora sp. NBRC 106378]GLZ55668.1 hypothetical protein Acsp07_52850 [Actinomycetospora sp. NBRC 106378]